MTSLGFPGLTSQAVRERVASFGSPFLRLIPTLITGEGTDEDPFVAVLYRYDITNDAPRWSQYLPLDFVQVDNPTSYTLELSLNGAQPYDIPATRSRSLTGLAMYAFTLKIDSVDLVEPAKGIEIFLRRNPSVISPLPPFGG